jgi:hypothetical protein
VRSWAASLAASASSCATFRQGWKKPGFKKNHSQGGFFLFFGIFSGFFDFFLFFFLFFLLVFFWGGGLGFFYTFA